MPDLSRPEFTKLVRDALLHLYDPAHLQTHPLVQLVKPPPGTSASLRGRLLLQELLEAIRALCPSLGTPGDSRAWRTYHLLELRYIEGQSAAQVAEALALGKSQYHTDHARALDAVASSLWDRWLHLSAAVSPPAESASLETLALGEAGQLAAHLRLDYLDVAALLDRLLSILRSVGTERRVALRLHARPDLPPVYADRVVLRQVCLGLLEMAVGRAVSGTVDVSVELIGASLQVAVVFTTTGDAGRPTARNEGRQRPSTPSHALATGRAELDLGVARRLVEALGGELTVEAPDSVGQWTARVRLPAARQPLVLVVDNDPSFIEVIARFLEGHGWLVAGALDASRAEALARELRPSVILLDVMMPEHDGWDLLLALRTDPESREIPVIVCSILYEPQVARAFGAVGYLAKPVGQSALLASLAPWRKGSQFAARGGSEPGLLG